MTSSVVLGGGTRQPSPPPSWRKMDPVPERETDRARRLRRVFGDLLPDSTGDDQPDQREDSSQEHDRWLRENRPPHHDDGG